MWFGVFSRTDRRSQMPPRRGFPLRKQYSKNSDEFEAAGEWRRRERFLQ
jgi:hypothetical protein